LVVRVTSARRIGGLLSGVLAGL